MLLCSFDLFGIWRYCSCYCCCTNLASLGRNVMSMLGGLPYSNTWCKYVLELHVSIRHCACITLSCRVVSCRVVQTDGRLGDSLTLWRLLECVVANIDGVEVEGFPFFFFVKVDFPSMFHVVRFQVPTCSTRDRLQGTPRERQGEVIEASAIRPAARLGYICIDQTSVKPQYQTFLIFQQTGRA